MLPLGRGQIFEQLDLVPITLQHRDRDARARHAGDFTGQFTGLMWSMRELEPEHIPPESERPFKVRHGNAGVVGCDDAKGLPAHVVQASFKSASLRFQMLLSPGAADLLASPGLIWSAILPASRRIRFTLGVWNARRDGTSTTVTAIPDEG